MVIDGRAARGPESLSPVLVLIGMLVLAVLLLASPGAWAQSRNLPKAGFQSMIRGAGPAGTALPRSSGVHLTPGLDRGPNGKIEPYPPGEPSLNGALARWESRKMPLLIWISPGIKLPDAPLDALTQVRVDEVYEMLRQPEPFKGLEICPGWTSEINYAVAAGIEQWREFEAEGLLSFGFTEDPRAAHILVFFTDTFKGGEDAPGGVNVAGNTVAKLLPARDIWAAEAQGMRQPQFPVIIELSTMINSTPERMQRAAAHEFGHALGIKAHSPYREDLMFVDELVDQLSPADKATFRWLYKQTPQFVM